MGPLSKLTVFTLAVLKFPFNQIDSIPLHRYISSQREETLDKSDPLTVLPRTYDFFNPQIQSWLLYWEGVCTQF
jgi:hypothetical protein